MTEDEAKAWVVVHYGEAALPTLAKLHDLIVAESTQQNLVAPSTLDQMWSRHLVDSAQLLRHIPPHTRKWTDIGSGAGFPGIVVALLSDLKVTLVEPRARRAAFLRQLSSDLAIAHRTTILQSKAEAAPADRADVISARAVSSIDDLFTMTAHLRSSATRYLLPRGRSGRHELAAVTQRWHGLFHVEQSLTDPSSVIVIADGVSR
jgi:16S rRNA (guanine527-N7)-methyltransferase